LSQNDVTVKIGGDSSELKEELGSVKKSARDLEKDLAKVATISAAAFAGLTAALGLTVAQFAKFDNEMRGVKTLLTDTAFGTTSLEVGFKKMSDEALALGSTVPVEIGKVTKALFDTVSAGVDAGDATKFVAEAAKLAVSGLTDVSVATDGMTSALNAYGENASRANAIASKFFVAQKQGKTTVEELASGFGLVGSTASAMGVSMDELFASVSAVTSAGVRTNAAYTGLKAALANISAPTEKAKEEAKALGIEFNAGALRAKGFSGFLDSIKNSAGFTKDSITKLFGSVEAQNIVFALAGKQSKNFADNLKLLGDETKSADIASKAYDTQSKSLTNRMKILKGQVTALAIQIGEKLEPVVSEGVAIISLFFKKLEQNKSLVKVIALVGTLGVALTGIVATLSVAGLAFLKFWAVLKSGVLIFGALKLAAVALAGATGIGLLVIAITTLASIWDGKIKFMTDLWDSLVNKVKAGAALVSKFLGIEVAQEQPAAAGPGTSPDAPKEDPNAAGEAVAQKKAAQLAAEQAGNDALTEEQIRFREENLARAEEADEREKEIAAAKREAEKEKKEIENLEDLEERQAHFDALYEQDEEFRNAFNELSAADQEKQKNEILKNVETEKNMKRKAADDAFKAAEANRKKERDAKTLHAKAMLKIDEFQQSAQYKGVKSAFGELGALAESENEKLKKIGKAASIVNMTIAGIESAINIYRGFSTIPIVGQALGIAGAAASLIFTGTKIAQVQALNQGGFVQPNSAISQVMGSGPDRDSVLTALTPGELVIPRNSASEVLDAVASVRAQENEETDETAASSREIIIGFTEQASEFLTVNQIEDRAIGVSREG